MKAYQIYLVEDKEIPQFKVLRWREVNADLKTILLQGVHPAGFATDSSGRDSSSIADRLLKELNDDQSMIPELRQLGYCPDVTLPRHPFCSNETPLAGFFRTVADEVYFTDNLRYVDLLAIAKEQLSGKWSHNIAKQLLMSTHGGFNEVRMFLKSRDKKMKLSGYSDIDNYDLGNTLTMEDFSNYEKTLISHGMPRTNFRSAGFIEKVTMQNSRNLIGFGKPINDFQVFWCCDEDGSCNQFVNLVYECRRNGEKINFMPNIDRSPGKRQLAKSVAWSYGKGTGKYCFNVQIEEIEQMAAKGCCAVRFPHLSYMQEASPVNAEGEIAEGHIERFFIGQYITSRIPNEKLKDVLQVHGVPMTGRKEELLEKMYCLLAELYEKRKKSFAGYFAKKRFLQISGSNDAGSKRFDVTENTPVNNTLLSMYVLKHLRGNTILDASHENDTFGLKDLAKSLLNGEVKINGSFLRVG